ncbi:hypothetical protein MKW94_027105 [Papaver nudicaule]|uniref:TNase-like domain-containing protein n=1 Tax=Papaver nudicaule TaxID=74823 RepID=A0AA41SMD8_PAPNU|nr:hypothetical protein [Papaver nudicaule]
MGNAMRFLYGSCCKPKTQEDSADSYGHHHHDVPTTTTVVGVSALAHDLLNYEHTCQVPEGLSQYVASSKKAQAKWYGKLLQAWKEAQLPPRTRKQASRFVIQALNEYQKTDVEGLLRFYGLPIPRKRAEIPGEEVCPATWPEGVQFELHTFPVDPKAVGDGDGLTVYVDATDPREAPNVPRAVQLAVLRRAKARASRDYTTADALQQNIADADYRVFNGSNNEDILAKKYRIRLRGIDAPEMQMPYGKEAKEELTKLLQGQCLTIGVYGEDQFGRLVGDVHCNGKFVQKTMLRKGLAWHYEMYDKRPELKKWEKQARDARVGLWASPNPQKPWEWRKNNRRE